MSQLIRKSTLPNTKSTPESFLPHSTNTNPQRNNSTKPSIISPMDRKISPNQHTRSKEPLSEYLSHLDIVPHQPREIQILNETPSKYIGSSPIKDQTSTNPDDTSIAVHSKTSLISKTTFDWSTYVGDKTFSQKFLADVIPPLF